MTNAEGAEPELVIPAKVPDTPPSRRRRPDRDARRRPAKDIRLELRAIGEGWSPDSEVLQAITASLLKDMLEGRLTPSEKIRLRNGLADQKAKNERLIYDRIVAEVSGTIRGFFSPIEEAEDPEDAQRRLVSEADADVRSRQAAELIGNCETLEELEMVRKLLARTSSSEEAEVLDGVVIGVVPPR